MSTNHTPEQIAAAFEACDKITKCWQGGELAGDPFEAVQLAKQALAPAYGPVAMYAAAECLKVDELGQNAFAEVIERTLQPDETRRILEWVYHNLRWIPDARGDVQNLGIKMLEATKAVLEKTYLKP